MKIQLSYVQPAAVSTDLLVVILDPEMTFHDLSGSPTGDIVQRLTGDFREKRLKRWKRRWKVQLIEGSNPDWHDLYPSIASG